MTPLGACTLNQMRRTLLRKYLRIAALTAIAGVIRAQTAPVASPALQSTSAPDLKLFEAATGLANTLISWGLVMIGGSILAIIGTSYYRPGALWVRCSYLAFLPAWFFLSLSIYAGTRVQGVYLAALYSKHPNIDMFKDIVNDDAASQIRWMEVGLACFGIWLMLYLAWWIFHNENVSRTI